MIGLSKSRILAHKQCPRRLWLQVKRPELIQYDDSATHQLAVGHTVGDVARQLFPKGRLVQSEKLQDAIQETVGLMDVASKEVVQAIFEATYQFDGVLVRIDLLLPLQPTAKWCMIEVKSSTKLKPYQVMDAAVQSWVLKKCGLELYSVQIANIDNTFVYPGNGRYERLFHFSEISQECAALEPDVQNWINAARSTLEGDDPGTLPGAQCHDPYDCPFLHYCIPETTDRDSYPPSLLPYAGTLAEDLRNEGYTDLREVPAGRLTNPKHIRIWQATCDGKAILDGEAADLVNALPYPRYYIDFETIQFAVPIWAGTRPYAQLPFQWSCHIEVESGRLEHREFLANDANDPRREFAETLLAALSENGPIIVYNAAFERSRLLKLARDFPDRAAGLEALVDRMVDLLPIARQHYYHPDMRGSWSIKAVLPTIAPELAYDGLAVADGGMAQEAYLEMIHPDTTSERRAKLREGLLEYCERDTFAMVRVAHHFSNGSRDAC